MYRNFVIPDKKEITKRKQMYEKTKYYGINLLMFDGVPDEQDEQYAKDVREVTFIIKGV